MYVVLTWKPKAGVASASVANQIKAEMESFNLVNIKDVFDRQIAANIKSGRGSGDAFDLEWSLRQKAPGRFTFTLQYLPRGQEILHSDDLNDAVLRGIADF